MPIYEVKWGDFEWAKDTAQSACQIKKFALGIACSRGHYNLFSKFAEKILTKHVKIHLEVFYDVYSLLNQ